MESLRTVARLFGHLLLYELDTEMLAELSRGDTRVALQDLGIQAPAGAEEDALAAEFFECFVHPKNGAPPIASLWIDGDYGGSCRRDIERWAESVGFCFEPQSQLASVPDHLGSLLLLWAELYPQQPEQAAELGAQLQQWAPRALAGSALGRGFYGDVSRGLIEFVGLISGEPVRASGRSHGLWGPPRGSQGGGARMLDEG